MSTTPFFYQSYADKRIQNALAQLSLDGLVTAMQVVATSDLTTHTLDLSHVLVSFAVRHATSSTDDDRFMPKFKSSEIGQQTIKQYGYLQHREAKRLFNVYVGNPPTSVTGGWIFEGLVHSVLCGQSSASNLRGPLLTMKREGSRTAPKFVTQENSDADAPRHLPLGRRSFTVVDFGEKAFASAFINNIENQSCVPKTKNNPLFDSFFVELKTDPDTAVVWIFQITTAEAHGGSPRGYPLIKAI
ncbi:uncharacterized protein PHACADRAFT_266153 [Phanerochaete carnosa HHB-10118-sp]|uniref:Uncharacterized protein n=1 Tax=Phanerochaete carnosa (strain HHB-10118-sp) TaxID=650164 RepID=K5VQA5_PHACS|nr:uncharacterized protein PHACADRAFT_266153 [Phanerochaete carnosa HHB-10118-sp]EKM48769.1 hypothetical protein PHACADRAFT_266153 [Phanerochaete carnosa HHB-10118-sp]